MVSKGAAVEGRRSGRSGSSAAGRSPVSISVSGLSFIPALHRKVGTAGADRPASATHHGAGTYGGGVREALRTRAPFVTQLLQSWRPAPLLPFGAARARGGTHAIARSALMLSSPDEDDAQSGLAPGLPAVSGASGRSGTL